MKGLILFTLLFFGSYLKAQLCVDQLINDSLVKAFVSQQTGKKIDEIILVTAKQLKSEKVLRIHDSKLDSIEQVQKVFADFNLDGIKDMVVSYSIKSQNQKHYREFYVDAFLSRGPAVYNRNKIWEQYEHVPGVVVKMFPESKQIVLSRFQFDYDEERIIFDTLKYFQGEFINTTVKCEKMFSSFKFYTTSNWAADVKRVITLLYDGSLIKEENEIGSSSTFKGILRPAFFDSLKSLICEINPENLNRNYEMPFVRDAGTFHLRVQYGDEIKEVDDYGWAGNFGLVALYKMLWLINKETNWVLISTNKPDYKLNKMPGKN